MCACVGGKGGGESSWSRERREKERKQRDEGEREETGREEGKKRKREGDGCVREQLVFENEREKRGGGESETDREG